MVCPGHISFIHIVFLLHTQCHCEENLWNEDFSSATHTQACLSAHSRSAENHCWSTAVRSPSWEESSIALCSRKSCKVLTRWSSGYKISWSSGLSPGMWTYAYRGQIWEIIKVGTIRFSESKKSKILLLGQGDICFSIFWVGNKHSFCCCWDRHVACLCH